jgi:hypothetical protein
MTVGLKDDFVRLIVGADASDFERDGFHLKAP